MCFGLVVPITTIFSVIVGHFAILDCIFSVLWTFEGVVSTPEWRKAKRNGQGSRCYPLPQSATAGAAKYINSENKAVAGLSGHLMKGSSWCDHGKEDWGIMLTVLHFTLSHTHTYVHMYTHVYTHATACPQSLLHTTPHHTTTTPHTAPHHTRARTHTCNLVFLEVFIVVVAEELVELAQPNKDLLRKVEPDGR